MAANKEMKTLNGYEIVDAKAREEKLDKQQGTENSEKLLYIGDDGTVSMLTLADGLKIVKKTGKNIIKEEWGNGLYNETGWVDNGTGKSWATVKELTPVEPNGTYNISFAELLSGGAMYLYQFNADRSLISSEIILYVNLTRSRSFTVTDETRYVSFGIYMSGGVYWEDLIVKNLQLEVGTTESDYESYTITDVSIAVDDTDFERLSKEMEFFRETLIGNETVEKTGNWISEKVYSETITVESDADEVIHVGKNLFYFSESMSDYINTYNVVSINAEEQTMTLTMKASGATRVFRDRLIPATKGDKFTLSVDFISHNTKAANPLLMVYDAEGNILDSGCTGTYNTYYKAYLGRDGALGDPYTFEITGENVAFVKAGFSMQTGNGIGVDEICTVRVQFEKNDAPTEWEASKEKVVRLDDGHANTTAYEGLNILYSETGAMITVKWINMKVAMSVNGKTGDINLTADDVGALPIGYEPESTIVRRNSDIIPVVSAASRYAHNANGNWNVSKQLTMLVTTDMHNDKTRYESALLFQDALKEIDFGISLGDMMGSHFSDNDGTWFTAPALSSAKKVYPVIGNHDAGESDLVSKAATKQQQFDKFFAPLIDKLEMPNLTKTYYSVDTGYGVTLIVLDAFDMPDTLLNENTFSVTRGVSCFSQEQIDWFITTLAAIPADSHVLIATHFLVDPVDLVDGVWTQDNAADEAGVDGVHSGLIADIVDAWMRGAAFAKTYTVTNTYIPNITVNADFTKRGTGVFAGYVHGHTHVDYIAKVAAHPEQNVYSFASSANDAYQNSKSDLPREIGAKTEDCITTLTVDTISRTVKLVRIGSRLTFDMVQRDMISIDY